MTWTWLSFDLGDDFGFLLAADDEVFAYATPQGLRVPCFDSVDGARLFASQQQPPPTSPELESGGEYPLAPLVEFARGGPRPEALEDGWALLLDVASALGREGEVVDRSGAERAYAVLDGANTAREDEDHLRACVSRAVGIFRQGVLHLDRPRPR